MKQTIINLKEKIDNNYKKLQKKYVLTKVALKNLNDLIDTNASDEKICQWLDKHENIILSIEYNLKLIELEK